MGNKKGGDGMKNKEEFKKLYLTRSQIVISVVERRVSSHTLYLVLAKWHFALHFVICEPLQYRFLRNTFCFVVSPHDGL